MGFHAVSQQVTQRLRIAILGREPNPGIEIPADDEDGLPGVSQGRLEIREIRRRIDQNGGMFCLCAGRAVHARDQPRARAASIGLRDRHTVSHAGVKTPAAGKGSRLNDRLRHSPDRRIRTGDDR
jgi:hypothetical protein